MEQATIERLNEGRAKLSHDPERPLPFRIVRDRLLPILGDYTPTEEALRLLHNGTTKRADPLMLAGLAQVYGLDLEELDPAAAAVLRVAARGASAGRKAAAGPRDGRAGVGATPTLPPAPGGLPVRGSRCCSPTDPPRLPGAGDGVWMGTASLLAAVAAPPPRDVPVPSRGGRRRIDDHVEVRVA